MSRKYSNKHSWKIALLNPFTGETIEEETVDRIEKSKFICEKISTPKLKSYYYLNHKNPAFKVSKLSIEK